MFSDSAGGRRREGKKLLEHFQGRVCPSDTIILYKVSCLSCLTFSRVSDMLKIRSVDMVAATHLISSPRGKLLGELLSSLFE